MSRFRHWAVIDRPYNIERGDFMSDPNRRDFLKFLASLAFTQAASAKPFRIDIHHHFGPAVWVAEVKGRPLLQPANTTWTPGKSIEDMDRGSVAASVISIT